MSLFNFVKGADPDQVLEAFEYGLARNIYPSQNLQEIKYFPKDILKTIKYFKNKIIKSNKDIFLKIKSSIPVWADNEIICYPQHIIQMGVSGQEDHSPSQVMECKLEKVDILPLGKRKLEEFLFQVFGFKKEDRVFVNLLNNNALVISKSTKSISDQDEATILTFQQRFSSGTFIPQHDKRICQIVEKKSNTPCVVCQKEAAGPTTAGKEASAEEDKGKGISFSKEDDDVCKV